MTLDEVCTDISGDLERWKWQRNREWLDKVWDSLRMGGIWYYPLDQSMWTKTEEGFDKAPDVDQDRRRV
jgi:hypothetical protein